MTNQAKPDLKVEELRTTTLRTSATTDTTTAEQPIRDEARQAVAAALLRSLRKK
jgi:hypothetical protein